MSSHLKLSEGKFGRNIENALNQFAQKNEEIEVYPEFYKTAPEKRYKKFFSANSTFVTFTHLMRSMIGPTILAIPMGFKFGGLALSPGGFFVLIFIVTYNMRMLILNASHLAEREEVSVRTYDEVIYVAFNTCSNWTKRMAAPFKHIVNIMFFITYLDACIIFMIFMGMNVEAIMDHYFPDYFFNVRHYIFTEVFLLLLMSCIRNLKDMFPFSFISSFLLIGVVGILIGKYFIRDPKPLSNLDLVGNETTINEFINVVLFCLSGISISLTLKSSMRTPKHFLSFPGIFYISVTIVGVVFSVFGFLGYRKFGKETKASVLLNVPPDHILSIVIKAMAIVAVLFTTPLTFYVAFNVFWNGFLRKYFISYTPITVLSVEYLIRMSLIVLCFLVAFGFPQLGLMIVLKGAIFHSHLEVTIPPIVDYVTYYPEEGHGKYYCRLLRTIILCLLGIAFWTGGIIVSALKWDALKSYSCKE